MLGLDLLERLWQRNDLDDDEAMALATEAQQSVRRSGPKRKRTRARGRATDRG